MSVAVLKYINVWKEFCFDLQKLYVSIPNDSFINPTFDESDDARISKYINLIQTESIRVLTDAMKSKLKEMSVISISSTSFDERGSIGYDNTIMFSELAKTLGTSAYNKSTKNKSPIIYWHNPKNVDLVIYIGEPFCISINIVFVSTASGEITLHVLLGHRRRSQTDHAIIQEYTNLHEILNDVINSNTNSNFDHAYNFDTMIYTHTSAALQRIMTTTSIGSRRSCTRPLIYK